MTKSKRTKSKKEQIRRAIAIANIRQAIVDSHMPVAEFCRTKGINKTTMDYVLKGKEPSYAGPKDDFARACGKETYGDIREINSRNLRTLIKYVLKHRSGKLSIIYMVLITACAIVMIMSRNPIASLLIIVLTMMYVNVGSNIWSGRSVNDIYNEEVCFEGLDEGSEKYNEMKHLRAEKRGMTFINLSGVVAIVLILIQLL